MKFFKMYIVYERYPWEMGYPYYVELINIFPLMLSEWGKRVKQETETQMEYERQRQKTIGR